MSSAAKASFDALPQHAHSFTPTRTPTHVHTPRCAHFNTVQLLHQSLICSILKSFELWHKLLSAHANVYLCIPEQSAGCTWTSAAEYLRLSLQGFSRRVWLVLPRLVPFDSTCTKRVQKSDSKRKQFKTHCGIKFGHLFCTQTRTHTYTHTHTNTQTNKKRDRQQTSACMHTRPHGQQSSAIQDRLFIKCMKAMISTEVHAHQAKS